MYNNKKVRENLSKRLREEVFVGDNIPSIEYDAQAFGLFIATDVDPDHIEMDFSSHGNGIIDIWKFPDGSVSDINEDGIYRWWVDENDAEDLWCGNRVMEN